MVSAFEFQAAEFKHMSHSTDLCLALSNRLCACEVESWLRFIILIDREGLLEVDPSFEIVGDEQLLCFGFSRQCVAIKVAT